jgi:hypothetical protein
MCVLSLFMRHLSTSCLKTTGYEVFQFGKNVRNRRIRSYSELHVEGVT